MPLVVMDGKNPDSILHYPLAYTIGKPLQLCPPSPYWNQRKRLGIGGDQPQNPLQFLEKLIPEATLPLVIPLTGILDLMPHGLVKAQPHEARRALKCDMNASSLSSDEGSSSSSFSR